MTLMGHRGDKRPADTEEPTPTAQPITSTETPSFVFVFGAPLGENDSPVWIMMLKHYGPYTAYNCDIVFTDDDRKNIEHQWLVEHPDSSFLPVGGVAVASEFSYSRGGARGSN